MLNEKNIHYSTKIKTNSLPSSSRSKINLLESRNINLHEDPNVFKADIFKDSLNFNKLDNSSINSKVKTTKLRTLGNFQKFSPSRIPINPPETIYHSKYQNFKSKIPRPN